MVGAGASALLDDRRGRRGVELAAATVLIVTVLWAAGTTSLGWLALLLTLLGATLVLVSLLVPDRAVLRWVATVPLGAAYVLRLVASDVGVVEAYTVPFALVLLAGSVGAPRAHGRTAASTAAHSPCDPTISSSPRT